LDPWQRFVLDRALGEQRNGKWSAFEVGLVVPRQNGKGSILEARELAGLFLFDERLILHSAHEFKTAAEAFRRVLELVQNTPDLERRVQKVRTSHGDEGIELRNGARLRFVARSTGSGRGFSGDLIIMDEAYNLGAKAMAALLPTLSARPNPQLWYTSSAGMDDSEQLRAVRERGITGESPSLAYFEWSSEPDADLDDRKSWAAANPAFGIRIPETFIERERQALPDREFARERLGIWDDHASERVIDPVLWAKMADSASKPADPVAFACDITPDRRSGSIAACGRRSDGRLHLEIVENRPGTGWMVARTAELVENHHPCAVALDPGGPVGSLVPLFAEAGLKVTELSARELGQACGGLHDDVSEDSLRHLGQIELDAAVGMARRRPLGDAWRFSRKGDADISPLYAATVARFAFLTAEQNPVSRYEERGLVTL
jgi:phage terminase large subunit-like protein